MVGGLRLSTAERWVIRAVWSAQPKDATIGVDVQECHARIGKPAKGLKRDRARVADHDQAS
jgi:hypothetical protein